MKIIDSKLFKVARSEDYNYNFDKVTGRFERWGKTLEDDPQFSKVGPEILDLELSAGKCNGNCSFCYKGNGNVDYVNNMTLETFKTVLSKFNRNLCQIAFGLCDIDTNPDFFPIMEHTRKLGIIPNYTCNGIGVTKEFAKKTAKLCGAVAVSVSHKNAAYDAIKKFTDAGMKQVNIHAVLSNETYDNLFNIVNDMKNDPRLKKMNAIVFLQYKHKNPKSPFTSMLEVEKYRKLVDFCMEKQVSYGFDSCSAGLFIKSVSNHEKYEHFKQVCEPCEICCFSSYINWEGKFFPCSFSENVPGWEDGLDVVNCENFTKDVWYNPRVVEFRNKLHCNNRNCPIYKI